MVVLVISSNSEKWFLSLWVLTGATLVHRNLQAQGIPHQTSQKSNNLELLIFKSVSSQQCLHLAAGLHNSCTFLNDLAGFKTACGNIPPHWENLLEKGDFLCCNLLRSPLNKIPCSPSNSKTWCQHWFSLQLPCRNLQAQGIYLQTSKYWKVQHHRHKQCF